MTTKTTMDSKGIHQKRVHWESLLLPRLPMSTLRCLSWRRRIQTCKTGFRLNLVSTLRKTFATTQSQSQTRIWTMKITGSALRHRNWAVRRHQKRRWVFERVSGHWHLLENISPTPTMERMRKWTWRALVTLKWEMTWPWSMIRRGSLGTCMLCISPWFAV